MDETNQKPSSETASGGDVGLQSLVRCPACGSRRTESGQPSRRVFFTCDSYAYENRHKLIDQTDLCAAWETIKRIGEVVTTDYETKEDFISRVRLILST